MDEKKTSATILLIDDDSELIDIFGDKLGAEGFTVWKTHKASEGIGLANTHKPDLVILDLNMPEMDGVEALRQMRLDPETKDLKVVLLTSYHEYGGEAVNDVFAKKIGADGLIEKEADLGVLAEKVREMVG